MAKREIRAAWSDIFQAWPAVELDLHDRGIDIESGILHERSWRWLRNHLLGLISTPSSRLYRVLLNAPKKEEPHGVS